MFREVTSFAELRPNHLAIVAVHLDEAILSLGREALGVMSADIAATHDALRRQATEPVLTMLSRPLDSREVTDLSMAHALGQLEAMQLAVSTAWYRRAPPEFVELLGSERAAPILARLHRERMTREEVVAACGGGDEVGRDLDELHERMLVLGNRSGRDWLYDVVSSVRAAMDVPSSTLPAAVLRRRLDVPETAAGVADVDRERILGSLDALGTDDAHVGRLRTWVDTSWRDPSGLGRSWHHDLFAAMARAGTATDGDLRQAVDAYWSRAADVVAEHVASAAPGSPGRP